MKKKIFIISILFVCLFVTGCNNIEKEESVLSIVATTFPGYDFARAVVSENEEVSLEMLLTPGSDAHSYEPSPQDIINIQNSDVFIYVGGDSDSWVDDILEDMDTSNITIIKLMDIVEVKEEELVEGMEDDHEHEEDEDEEDHEHEEEEEEVEYDEHVWTSPVNAALIVEYIANAIITIDEENEELYETTSNKYITELEIVDQEFEEIVASTENNLLVFGDRFPFRYFVDEYNLEYSAAFPGCSDSTEASASTIAYLIDKINDENIPVVLKIELSSSDIADTISDATNAEVLEFNAGHNISQENFDAGVTMIDIYRNNEEVLIKALS